MNSALQSRRWVVVVHGGAKSIASDKAEGNRAGCRAAAAAGARVLSHGGLAVEAARLACKVLEDDPRFNAGHGSVRNAAGGIEMDAAIMDGSTLAIGAVAAVRRIRNPIDAAHAMLDADAILLVSEGAEDFARTQGIALMEPASEEAAADTGHDTIGCVAMDVHGNFAAATSTGGIEGTDVGRVGDSPLPGCGFYADNGVGAVAMSGDGEAIARTLLAGRIMRALERNSAGRAAAEIAEPLARVGGEAGAIVIDSQARVGIAHTSSHFAVAVAASDLDTVGAAIHRDELKAWIDDD